MLWTSHEQAYRLKAIIVDRSALQKHEWRANISPATADGCGTAKIMRRSGKSKPEMAGAVHGRGCRRADAR
jgi:hypothetical protein